MFLDARAHVEEAVRLHEAGELDEALPRYLAILDAVPNNQRVLFLLGQLYCQKKHWGLAIAVLSIADAVSPLWPPVLQNLGLAWKETGNVQRARMCWEAAIEHGRWTPDVEDVRATIFGNLSGLYLNDSEPEQAIAWADKALAIEPGNETAQWNKGTALLLLGRWREGWPFYIEGLRSQERIARDYTGTGLPPWDGKSPGRLVVYGEQGMGDELMYASMIPDVLAVPGVELILDCHPRMVGLMRRSFGIPCHGTRKDSYIDWIDEYGGKFDWQMAIGSLGLFFRPEPSSCPGTPYLKADPVLTAKVRQRLDGLGPGPKIGLGWRGGKLRTRTDLRSIELEKLAPLIATPGATFISLQYTPEAIDEATHLAWKHGLTVHHWPEVVEAFDYDTTGALVSALDLSILVNTSAVHLCGGLGVPCWTLTPRRCAWREAGPPHRLPWYNSVVAYRTEADEWEPTIERVRVDLESWLRERAAA